MNDATGQNHARSLAAIVAEIREELKTFLNTRAQMVKSEFREMLVGFRVGLPLIVLALAFIGTGFLLLTAAVVAIVVSAFAGNPYAWFLAFVIVGLLWVVLGAGAGFLAY